jgi:RNA polymerase sigma-70 factor (ECF subfamily)
VIVDSGILLPTVRPTSNLVLQLLLRDREKYLNFLISRIRDRDLAEEILQIVTLKVIERGYQLRVASRAEAWLYRVLRNALTDYDRKAGNTPVAAENDSFKLESALPISASNPCQCASNELTQLRPEYAEVLRAVAMEDTSILKYARALTITPNAASVRLHRARKSLRGRIMSICGSCAGAGCFDCSC